MRLVVRFSLSVVNLFMVLSKCADRGTRFLASLLAVIMTPKEILDYTKRAYNKTLFFDYSNADYVKRGLFPWEKYVVDKYAVQKGSFLILGAGGGRESIALANLGYKVLGMDSSEDMIRVARENAVKEGISIDFQLGDIMDLSFPGRNFDYCMLSCSMYSIIPTRKMRIEVLSKIGSVLKDNGLVITHSLFNSRGGKERLNKLRKFIAKIFRGNTDYLPGDQFLPHGHFFHIFYDENEIIKEAEGAGFIVKYMGKESEGERFAVLEKSCIRANNEDEIG